MKKLLLSAAIAACLLLGAVQSQAAFANTTTILGWKNAPSDTITTGNVTWVINDLLTTVPDGVSVTLADSGSLTVQANSTWQAGPQNWYLEYTADLTDGMVFSAVSVDSTLYYDKKATITKEVYNAANGALLVTVKSVNGVPSNLGEFTGFPGVNTILVKETIKIEAGTTLGDFGNTFVVPEPSTVLAGSLLLLPFAASTIRRFRKNKA
jgi:hypothetical protein